MSQIIPLDPPVKGVNRTFARGKQPALTCWDALNMLPFDRHDRLRVGQRAGTEKMQETAIGDGGVVYHLGLATASALSGPLNEDDLIDDQDFSTYANGDLPSSLWRVGADNGLNQYPDTPANALTISSSRVNIGAGTPANNYGVAWRQDELVLGNSYAIVLNADLQTSATPAQTSPRGNIVSFRLDRNDPPSSTMTQGAWLVEFNISRVSIRMSDGAGGLINATEYIHSPALSVGLHTCEVRVNGNTATVIVDSTTYITKDITPPLPIQETYTGLGFQLFNSAAGRVHRWRVYATDDLLLDRDTRLVAVAGGDVYYGSLVAGLTVATSGTGVLSQSVKPQGAWASQFYYFVNGIDDIIMLNLNSSQVQTYTPTAGSETASTLGAYRLIAFYRNRMVLANSAAFPETFICSRIGTHTDWNYSATDAAGAFAGNASESGRIGEPILALIPHSDDILIIAGDHNIWAMVGDPKQGGSIDLVSDAIGIMGPESWCKSPDGTIYFVGTTGLFKMVPGSQPELLSAGSYNQYFKTINRASQYVLMSWDRDRHGANIYVTPANPAAAVHLWYDARTDSLWPKQYPTNHGPVCAVVYDGNHPDDRVELLGGRTGFIQKVVATARDDDGTAISSYVVLGPFKLSNGDALVTAVTLDLGELIPEDVGEDRWNCRVVIRTGKTAYEVTEGTTYRKATTTLGDGGRTKTMRNRLRGAWAAVELSNDELGKYLGYEAGELEYEPAGFNRKQR